MAKMYTLDEKLLIGTPEIRIKDKVYPVDDREKTVKKIIALTEKADTEDIKIMDEVLKLAFSPKDFKEIDNMNLPWEAYSGLLQLVITAVTGREPEKDGERFQEE